MYHPLSDPIECESVCVFELLWTSCEHTLNIHLLSHFRLTRRVARGGSRDGVNSRDKTMAD